MKANPFNICPTCKHKYDCVLTDQKEKVWSCSDFEEAKTKKIQIAAKVVEPELEEVF